MNLWEGLDRTEQLRSAPSACGVCDQGVCEAQVGIDEAIPIKYTDSAFIVLDSGEALKLAIADWDDDVSKRSISDERGDISKCIPFRVKGSIDQTQIQTPPPPRHPSACVGFDDCYGYDTPPGGSLLPVYSTHIDVICLRRRIPSRSQIPAEASVLCLDSPAPSIKSV